MEAELKALRELVESLKSENATLKQKYEDMSKEFLAQKALVDKLTGEKADLAKSNEQLTRINGIYEQLIPDVAKDANPSRPQGINTDATIDNAVNTLFEEETGGTQ